MTKPDAFEKMVAHNSWRLWARGSQVKRDLAVAALLRRYHAKVRRVVQRMEQEKLREIQCIDDGYCDRDLNRPAEVNCIQREIQVCADILAALDRLAGKGKR